MGRAVQGQRPFSRSANIRGHKDPFSAIVGLSLQDIVEIKMIDITSEGNVNVQTFYDALSDEILPKTNRYNRANILPLSVLILDNARTHDKISIDALCLVAGVCVLYPPPYSYNLSPIESFLVWLLCHVLLLQLL